MSGGIPYARFAGWVSQSAGKDKMKAVRIEYWVQDTLESGHWELTGLLKKDQAELLRLSLERGRIVDNDEDFQTQQIK